MAAKLETNKILVVAGLTIVAIMFFQQFATAKDITAINVGTAFVILFLSLVAYIIYGLVYNDFKMDRQQLITLLIVVGMIYFAGKFLFPQLGADIFKTASMLVP